MYKFRVQSSEFRVQSSAGSMRMRSDSRVSGFTLIELSIVLVIIGLITGGVLVGRDLIRATEIRKTIAEMDKVTVAVNVFQLKYNCFAGDCPNATSFFNATTQPDRTTNGNGDGIIGGATPMSTSGEYPATERAYFFDHLANASLVNFSPSDENSLTAVEEDIPSNYIIFPAAYPKTPVGSGFFIHAAVNTVPPQINWITVGGHAMLLGITTTASNSFYTVNSEDQGLISAPDAFAIDTKLDDGLPLLGMVRALFPNYGDDNTVTGFLSQPEAPGSGSCTSNANGQPYSSTKNDTCSLSIKAGF